MFRTALSRSSSLAARSIAASTGSMQVSMRFSALRGLASWPSHTVLSLPALSPTMESGGIAGWTLKEGDAINPGESICEVETDKATVDFEAQDEGFLAKILVPAGTSDVAVGTPIGVMVESESDIAAFKDFTAADAGAKPAASAEEPKKAAEEPKKPVEEPKKAAEAPKKPVEEPKKAAEPKPAVASQPAASQPNPPKTTAAKPKAKQSLPQMKSPLQAILEKAQSDYEKQYGITGLCHKKADKPAAASA